MSANLEQMSHVPLPSHKLGRFYLSNFIGLMAQIRSRFFALKLTFFAPKSCSFCPISFLLNRTAHLAHTIASQFCTIAIP